MYIWLVFSFDVSDLLESKVTGSKACNATIPCRRSYHKMKIILKNKGFKQLQCECYSKPLLANLVTCFQYFCYEKPGVVPQWQNINFRLVSGQAYLA